MKHQKVDLRSVVVRPVFEQDEALLWNKLMREQHYLESSQMVGKQIRYVAECKGEWVALLGCSAAVFKSKHRDQWIGWNKIKEKQRLHLIVQNSRFLVLEGKSQPNLASKCLSLLSKRVSKDWEDTYGHPVYVLETFVDKDRPGTCYQACGWKRLGETAGFRRTRGGYTRHNIKKSYWVLPLRRNARHLLGSNKTPDDIALDPLQPNDLPLNPEKGSSIHTILKKYFPRIKGKSQIGQPYPLDSTVALVLTGYICGVEDIENVAAWAKELDDKSKSNLRCPYRCRKGKYGYATPCANTIRYALQEIDANKLEAAMREWVELCGVNIEKTHLALDGKIIRGARTEEENAPNHVTLYDVDSGVVLDQELVPDKTTEVPVARSIFKRNDLAGTMVTADAAHTNVETANLLKKKALITC